jgi:antitoxin component YwqK of YwqJK toxin-antitoxin module
MKKPLLILSTLAVQLAFGQTIVKKYPSGQILSEVNYKDSLKHGIAKYYFEDGKTDAIIEFDNGKLTGTIKEFYETGYPFREIDVKTGKAKFYSRDSSTFYLGTYTDTRFMRNGTWEQWEINSNFKRFTWTFANDVKHGPYTAHRKDGSVEATGHYYNGTISDTLKLFDTNGTLTEIQVWKPNSDGKGSSHINTVYYTDMKSDGTPEMIDGKLFIWKDGKKVEVK